MNARNVPTHVLESLDALFLCRLTGELGIVCDEQVIHKGEIDIVNEITVRLIFHVTVLAFAAGDCFRVRVE